MFYIYTIVEDKIKKDKYGHLRAFTDKDTLKKDLKELSGSNILLFYPEWRTDIIESSGIKEGEEDEILKKVSELQEKHGKGVFKDYGVMFDYKFQEV